MNDVDRYIARVVDGMVSIMPEDKRYALRVVSTLQRRVDGETSGLLYFLRESHAPQLAATLVLGITAGIVAVSITNGVAGFLGPAEVAAIVDKVADKAATAAVDRVANTRIMRDPQGVYWRYVIEPGAPDGGPYSILEMEQLTDEEAQALESSAPVTLPASATAVETKI